MRRLLFTISAMAFAAARGDQDRTTVAINPDGVAVLTAPQGFTVAGDQTVLGKLETNGVLSIAGIPDVKVEIEAMQSEIDTVPAAIAAVETNAVASCNAACDLTAHAATVTANKIEAAKNLAAAELKIKALETALTAEKTVRDTLVNTLSKSLDELTARLTSTEQAVSTLEEEAAKVREAEAKAEAERKAAEELATQLGTQKNPAKTCKQIKAARKDAKTGIYWLKPKDTQAAFDTHCDMLQDWGGWTVVFKFNDPSKSSELFDRNMPRGLLKTTGVAKDVGMYTRVMPSSLFTEVAIQCVNSKMETVNNNKQSVTGTTSSMMRMASKKWIGTSWINGDFNWGTNQQFNTFGRSDSSETYFHSAAASWNELNLLDNSNTQARSTHMTGYGVWRGGQTGCGYLRDAGQSGGHGRSDNTNDNAIVSDQNQLVVMVR